MSLLFFFFLKLQDVALKVKWHDGSCYFWECNNWISTSSTSLWCQFSSSFFLSGGLSLSMSLPVDTSSEEKSRKVTGARSWSLKPVQSGEKAGG